MDADNRNAIERRIGHLERTLATHGQLTALNAEGVKQMMENSKERLEYIKERFDGIEGQMKEEKESHRFWTGTVLSIIFAVGVSVNYMYIEPLVESVKAVERRLLYVEQKIHAHMLDSDPPE